ncbi:GTPase, putative [Plasmodium gallinaceum]|uniref:GTPase, putative n=1 Tax=Plasmodium gallinaceum TaxID=5849 RepID=A0A1J1GM42_PLAGA|nr:GTPase, putative [Plasmodium gallinaceum]CRG93395.1 GTPase, putative [Plasmodium gallinaceum]
MNRNLFFFIKYFVLIFFFNYCRGIKKKKYNNVFLYISLKSYIKDIKVLIRKKRANKNSEVKDKFFLSYKNIEEKKNEQKNILEDISKNEVMKNDYLKDGNLRNEYLNKLLSNRETIYALSSGNVLSAISIIRISGELSKIILEILLHKNSKKNLINFMKNVENKSNDGHSEFKRMKKKNEYNLDEIINLKKNFETRKLYMGELYDNDNNVIDKIMFAYFENPKSYTGEDIVEIYCHGNPFIIKEIMNEISNLNELFYKILKEEKENYYNNASNYINTSDEIKEKLHDLNDFIKIRESKKGEFTRRAFENNKMNMLEVEGLKELLFCKQKIQKKIALNYLSGYAKNIYMKLKKNLKKLLVFTQFKIDFEDEHTSTERERSNINNFFNKKLNDSIKNIKEILKKENVEDLSNSLDVLIFGNVNSGKSTLMNYICNDNISIVTNIKGSTIDVIQKNIKIQNNSYNLCDSAGMISNIMKKSCYSKNDITTSYEFFLEKKEGQKNIHKKLEFIGIQKTLTYLKKCLSVITLLNINHYVKELKNIIFILNKYFNKTKKKKKKKIPYFFICVNKCDLKLSKSYKNIRKNIKKILLKYLDLRVLKKVSKKIFFISSKKGYNIDKMLKYFNKRMMKKRNIKYSKKEKIFFLPFERHKIYLKKSLKHLFFIKKNKQNLTFDIIAEEIKLAVNSLNHIIGEFKKEQILNKILEKFCIGK